MAILEQREARSSENKSMHRWSLNLISPIISWFSFSNLPIFACCSANFCFCPRIASATHIGSSCPGSQEGSKPSAFVATSKKSLKLLHPEQIGSSLHEGVISALVLNFFDGPHEIPDHKGGLLRCHRKSMGELILIVVV